MDNNLYLYIPRDVVLNYQSRNHRGDNFRTIYYYKNKRRYKFNDKTINEIDIYHVKDLQKDTLYKSCFKSTSDKYFDWYYCLKPEYNECDSIYIENDKGYTTKKNREYEKNRVKKQQEYREKPKIEPLTGKFIVTFD